MWIVENHEETILFRLRSCDFVQTNTSIFEEEKSDPSQHCIQNTSSLAKTGSQTNKETGGLKKGQHM